jgi:2-polyprenyl-3-methyl-5-hydroxy-6-metoxy-1,4-benzoquinol methylase
MKNYQAYDHSVTYKKMRFRNIPHIRRLNTQKKIIKNMKGSKVRLYADVGCSTGYITDIISQILSPQKTLGIDFSQNIKLAKKIYPNYAFEYFDLNKVTVISDKADFITCFETLEHVGDLDSAIKNLKELLNETGILVISVPIEVGFIGLLKYVLKRFVYRDSFPFSGLEYSYVCDLLQGRDIMRYRKPASGYSSHFGFDYRELEKLLCKYFSEFQVRSHTNFTTAFFIVQKLS